LQRKKWKWPTLNPLSWMTFGISLENWKLFRSQCRNYLSRITQTELDISETVPQFDGNQSLDTQSEELLPMSEGVLSQVKLDHTVPSEDCSQTTLDEASDVELSPDQLTGVTKVPRKLRKRRKKKNAKKMSKTSRTVQAIHNVASLAGWSEAKLQHELRVFKSRCESPSDLSNCPTKSKKDCHRKSRVTEGLTKVVLPPFPHPMNVPPPCLCPSPRQNQPLYKVSPICQVSNPGRKQYVYKALSPQIPTQFHEPGKVQTWNSQDKNRTQHFYRNLPPFQNRLENSTPVEFWGRKFWEKSRQRKNACAINFI